MSDDSESNQDLDEDADDHDNDVDVVDLDGVMIKRISSSAEEKVQWQTSRHQDKNKLVQEAETDGPDVDEKTPEFILILGGIFQPEKEEVPDHCNGIAEDDIL